jgi:hypothetical protein
MAGFIFSGGMLARLAVTSMSEMPVMRRKQSESRPFKERIMKVTFCNPFHGTTSSAVVDQAVAGDVSEALDYLRAIRPGAYERVIRELCCVRGCKCQHLIQIKGVKS